MKNYLTKEFAVFFTFFLIIIISWLTYMSTTSQFYLFKENWYMTLTMIIGSFIAGATSEGGGAVAFPVMTIFFNISPAIARDFSLMIQTFGMLMAALAIILFKVKVLKKTLIITALSGAVGMAIGFSFLQGVFPPAYLKIFFTSLWLSFGFVLLKVSKTRPQQESLQLKETKDFLALCIIGILGGIVTSLTGSGIDILLFSYLTLNRGICIKVATPTSVVLMGISAALGFFIKSNFYQPMSLDAVNFLLVCIPVVIIGAPFGSLFIKDKTKGFVQNFLLVLIFIQYISSIILIKMSVGLITFSILTFFTGYFGFLKGATLKSHAPKPLNCSPPRT